MSKVIDIVLWVMSWGTLLLFFWFLLDFDLLIG
jgi:hypothetical protein